MTKEQHEKYERLSRKIAPVKNFLFWCGDRYHEDAVTKYMFSIKTIGRKFALMARRHWCTAEDNTFELPHDLQQRIVAVIEQYIDEKEKELQEI